MITAQGADIPADVHIICLLANAKETNTVADELGLKGARSRPMCRRRGDQQSQLGHSLNQYLTLICSIHYTCYLRPAIHQKRLSGYIGGVVAR